MLIDNKAGANGTIGVADLARSAPDGHTFGIVIAAHAANPSLYAKLPYDPNDLTAVSLIGVSPLVAAVNKDTPFKTARELVDYAKRNPGKLSFGSSGNGAAAHLTTELLKSMTQTDMVHIPYKGAAAALQDLMGGQIQLLFDAASGSDRPRQGGAGAADRCRGRTPAADAAGRADLHRAGHHRLHRQHLGRHAGAGAHAAGHRQAGVGGGGAHRPPGRRPGTARGHGHAARWQHPEEFAAFIDAEAAKWGKVIRDAKVKLD